MSVNWPRTGIRENSSIWFQVFFAKSARAAGITFVTRSASLVIVRCHLRGVTSSTGSSSIGMLAMGASQWRDHTATAI